MVREIYHYFERIWRIIIAPNFGYNINDNEKILFRWTSEYTYKIINKYYPREQLGIYHQKRVRVNHHYFVVMENG